ncbi:disease resistance protein [Tripterygium wilfordii]|uniref:Disease resistance protein n=1 Tax=Tripterygium wilfordii TaxID=458696 RepID=A0A7J7DLA0_TRIWF|nr:probable disease resistance protein At4g33300 [Tripterygium wilfordii]KAF5747073.1 disease resistance protein [Tripterygium wilfordii]
MAVTDFFAGEVATELIRMLIKISRKSLFCKSSADGLRSSIEELLPIIQEIKYTGVELPAMRQSQLNKISETLSEGKELAEKVMRSGRWNVYKNLQLARKMEKLEQTVSRFLNGPMQAHILADVHHVRFDTVERFDKLDGSTRRIEQSLAAMKIGVGGGGWVEEAVKTIEMEEERGDEDSLGNLGVGLGLGRRKVKELVIGKENLRVVGICGIGGSGKTTLATEICKDDEVKSYFNNNILFLTVSQSPDLGQLKGKIWNFVSGAGAWGSNDVVPHWNLQYECKIEPRMLIVLDDVWTLSVLEELIFKIPGCKTLVVSRFKFQEVFNATYEVQLLREDEALSLFCHSAFGQKSIPPSADANLVKQLVNECKGLPLALKVIGASLRDQPEMYWASAKKRLSRGEPICESHENKLLNRMAISVDYLPKKVRECFLDLGSFPEDKKIPLDVLINMWVEIHDIDAEDAFAILVELSNKNLLALVKDARAGDVYTSYYDIFVTQHDVLRDLALHLSNRESINDRKRLLMPKRDMAIPKEWERNSDQPFNAQVVSIHTGEMNEMDWCRMEFPKAEVLILNFASKEYFLPPFIYDMPKLKALIVINYSTFSSTLHNFSVFSDLANLKSLWLERVSICKLSEETISLKNLRKMSLVLCKINDSFDASVVDLPRIFPSLSELSIDHSDDLMQLPSSLCRMERLQCLSITNCHNLKELPTDLGMLKRLHILRLYACPTLKTLPSTIDQLVLLEYLDISQCVNMTCLPEGIGRLAGLKKIDMRECPQIWDLPDSAAYLRSLRRVICDEEVYWVWQDMKKAMPLPDLHVQVAEKCFSLDWLNE